MHIKENGTCAVTKTIFPCSQFSTPTFSDKAYFHLHGYGEVGFVTETKTESDCIKFSTKSCKAHFNKVYAHEQAHEQEMATNKKWPRQEITPSSKDTQKSQHHLTVIRSSRLLTCKTLSNYEGLRRDATGDLFRDTRWCLRRADNRLMRHKLKLGINTMTTLIIKYFRNNHMYKLRVLSGYCQEPIVK